MAVTLINSTPLRKRSLPAWIDQTRHPERSRDRPPLMQMMAAKMSREVGESVHQAAFSWGVLDATGAVEPARRSRWRTTPRSGSKRHAIALDVRSAGDTDDERGLFSRPKRRDVRGARPLPTNAPSRPNADTTAVIWSSSPPLCGLRTRPDTVNVSPSCACRIEGKFGGDAVA